MHGMAPGPHKEIEIKLEVGPSASALPFATVGNPSLGIFRHQQAKTSQKGADAAGRREGRHYRQTIKATGNDGNFERDEWEAKSRAMSRISIRPAGRRLNRF